MSLHQKLSLWKKYSGVDITGYNLIGGRSLHQEDFRVQLPFIGKTCLFCYIGEKIFYFDIQLGINYTHLVNGDIVEEDGRYYLVFHTHKILLIELKLEDFEETLNPIPLERRLARQQMRS